MSTFCIKCKCTACGLHFAAYSWEEEWLPKVCPECGQSPTFAVWREKLSGEIFQYVPGDSPIIQMT